MKQITFRLMLAVLSTTAVASAAQLSVRDADEPGGGGRPKKVISGLTFTFISPSGTSPFDPLDPLTSPCVSDGTDVLGCEFVNSSGVDWTTMRLTVSPFQTFDFCAAGQTIGFGGCTPVQTSGPGALMFDFFGGSGIRNAEAFGFTLVDWAPNTQFTVQANTPEPATWTLISVGAVLLAFSRRRWARGGYLH